jgi:hypothetical protein
MDANHDDMGVGWGEKVYGKISRGQWLGGSVTHWEGLHWTSCLVHVRPARGQGGKELEDGEQDVSDVVVKGEFIPLGETTGKEMIAMVIPEFFVEGASQG